MLSDARELCHAPHACGTHLVFSRPWRSENGKGGGGLWAVNPHLSACATPNNLPQPSTTFHYLRKPPDSPQHMPRIPLPKHSLQNTAERLNESEKLEAESRYGHLKDLRGNRSLDMERNFNERRKRGLQTLQRDQESSVKRVKTIKDSIYTAYKNILGDTSDLDTVMQALEAGSVPLDEEGVTSAEEFERQITGRVKPAAHVAGAAQRVDVTAQLQELAEVGEKADDLDLDIDEDLDMLLSLL